MNKYRIIELANPIPVIYTGDCYWYEVQTRFLWFMWKHHYFYETFEKAKEEIQILKKENLINKLKDTVVWSE